jgi:sialidase-1
VGEKRRAYAWSDDDGESFSNGGWDDNLPEPICQGSMIRYTDENTHDKNRVLFSNPASTQRERMTIRLSYDECQTWNAGKVIHAGPSAYSDLCVADDMSILCLYERGEENAYETITLAQFDLEWLTDGSDAIA